MDVWQFLLVFCAIAIGWWLGHRAGVNATKAQSEASFHPEYYKGLNYLLSDRPDGELDSFISSLEVTPETLETHISVGNLMRRKGEVDRAIRIHQNLLARPSLPREHLHRAHLELARDFVSAGLLDRAERLFEDLLVEAPELQKVARRHLLEIYQDEKEWEKAIEAAKLLRPKKSLLKASPPEDRSIVVTLSHYCCELAELSIAAKDFPAARSHLRHALNCDPACVRASLLMAKIEYTTQHYDRAIKALRKVRNQDISLVTETLELLKLTYRQLEDDQAFFDYLADCLTVYPSITIVLVLVEDLQLRKGDGAAVEFLGAELKRRPSLRGLAKLVELHMTHSTGPAKNDLGLLQLLIQQLTSNKAQYQCQHCGFSGKHIHWLCPGCKEWGKIKPIRGAEGD
ncbi:MAG: lipopolysaccharide biosynthesis regulator YciM [Oceanicoccus sp.]